MAVKGYALTACTSRCHHALPIHTYPFSVPCSFTVRLYFYKNTTIFINITVEIVINYYGVLSPAAKGDGMHHYPLITTIVGGAYSLLFSAWRLPTNLRISPLVGYLLAFWRDAFTPGFVADTKLAPELAELEA